MSAEQRRRSAALRKTKARIRKRVRGEDRKPRISVYRSLKHTYAQLISDESNKTMCGISTLDKEIREVLSKEHQSLKGVEAARLVGKELGLTAMKQGISEVVFDRNGLPYTGRVRAVAEGAREAGLKF